MPSVVSYSVAADPHAHEFLVSCMVAKPASRGQVFALPSWIRGSYLVRDFAKHVSALSARSGARELAIERIDKRSFRVAPVRGPLTLSWRVHAYDESVRKAYLDTRRGFFNGSSLFYLPLGHEHAVFEVQIEKPAAAECADWRIATTLPVEKVGRDGFGRYRARGYEQLIDCPVEMAAYERIDFKVDGIPHALVLSGRYEIDRERVAQDLARICHVERELFRQQPELDQYLFLTNVTGAGYGGLEHQTCTALICSRNDLPRPGMGKLTRDYRGFLGLCSHEYFHLWNVKRITPESFLDSDLAREAYTRDLWHYEGVTSYYDDLFLLRAGVLDAPGYLDVLAETATRLSRTPGRGAHTLADASFEAWIKYYQPDEQSPNVTVNYYVKGALAALCLDLTLRLRSKVTLDDVMRELWTRYGKRSKGVPEGGLEKIAGELSRQDLKPFFDRALRSTQELPLAELLAEFGVECTQRAQLSEADNGGRAGGEPPGAWLGVKLKPGEARI
ncbi:MAG TPA: M61 family peptidase, partial [Nevskiaceae bacterium]|nr:M61 family peptidase [Nevskiaceae bacterium]